MNKEPTNPYASPGPSNWAPERDPAGDHATSETMASEPMASSYLIAMRVIRSIGWKMLFVYSLVWLPLNQWLAYLQRDAVEWDELREGFRWQQAAEFWIGSIVTGALIVMTMMLLDGQRPGIVNAFGASLHRYGKILTTRICFGVIFLLGLVLLIFPAIYFCVRSLYAVEIAVRENVHGPTAIRRSFELTQNRFWETAGYLVAMVGVYSVVTVVYLVVVSVFYLTAETVEGFPIDENKFWIFEGFCAMGFSIPVLFSVTLAYSGYRRLVSFDERQVIS